MKKKVEQPEQICLSSSGAFITFVKARDKDYISYLHFQDGCGHYLGSLDTNFEKKELKKLSKWINHILKEVK